MRSINISPSGSGVDHHNPEAHDAGQGWPPQTAPSLKSLVKLFAAIDKARVLLTRRRHCKRVGDTVELLRTTHQQSASEL